MWTHCMWKNTCKRRELSIISLPSEMIRAVSHPFGESETTSLISFPYHSLSVFLCHSLRVPVLLSSLHDCLCLQAQALRQLSLANVHHSAQMELVSQLVPYTCETAQSLAIAFRYFRLCPLAAEHAVRMFSPHSLASEKHSKALSNTDSRAYQRKLSRKIPS